MTYLDREPAAEPRISWGSVIAGAIIAVAIGAMLNLLGVAMGAAALDPFDMSKGEAKGLAVAGGIWLAVSNAIALFVGAWIATRAGRGWNLRGAGLHSLAVWALAFTMALIIAGFTGTGFLGTLIRGGAEAPQSVAAASATAVDAQTMAPGDPINGDFTPADTAQAVENTADAAGAVAGWGFLTMLLGLLGALLGGWLAARDKDARATRVVDRDEVRSPLDTTPRL